MATENLTSFERGFFEALDGISLDDMQKYATCYVFINSDVDELKDIMTKQALDFQSVKPALHDAAKAIPNFNAPAGALIGAALGLVQNRMFNESRLGKIVRSALVGALLGWGGGQIGDFAKSVTAPKPVVQ